LSRVQDHEAIRGAELIFSRAIFSRVNVSALIAVLVWSASADLNARNQSRKWIVFKNCRLITNPANDGDSFHVSVGKKEYLFRLYFVDAPETDEMTPQRLIEQARHFSVTVPQAIEVGRAAKVFTEEKLSQRFTVFTHMSDAMGQSRLERFYAFVETREGDLGEQLVRNGLARSYGFKAAPPGLTSSRTEVDKLRQFEDAAKRERIGGWGIDAGRLNAHPQTRAVFSSFVTDGKTRARSTLADSLAIFFAVAKSAAPIAAQRSSRGQQ
jgi:endonuclease YncB( thermonuclease family)